VSVGTGTPGARLKRARPSNVPLRTFARDVARDTQHARHDDAIAWLETKCRRFRDASAPR